jgi:hypothetical protein
MDMLKKNIFFYVEHKIKSIFTAKNHKNRKKNNNIISLDKFKFLYKKCNKCMIQIKKCSEHP